MQTETLNNLRSQAREIAERWRIINHNTRVAKHARMLIAALDVVEAAEAWELAERIAARTDGLYLDGSKFKTWNDAYATLLVSLLEFQAALAKESAPSAAP